MWATGIWDGTLHISVRCLCFHVTCQILVIPLDNPCNTPGDDCKVWGCGLYAWEHRGLVSSQTLVWCRTQTPKRFLPTFIPPGPKKVCGEQSDLSLSFRIGFFQDATSGTCVPRRGPQTLVDRGQQKDSFSPFFR